MLEKSTDEEFSNPESLKLNDSDAITLTGMENGSYYFRIKDRNNQSSNIVNVIVEHHSLGKAFSFFSLGFCLFIILLSVLILGHKKSSMEVE